jgi:5-methyltetrahydropteroyltriglutamate--homocysteine methyltransferase
VRFRGATRDSLAFPQTYEDMRVMLAARSGALVAKRTVRPKAQVCVGPIAYVGQAELAADIENLKNALKGVGAEDAFMTAISPSNLELYYENQHYASDEEYLAALAEAMRVEYKAIVDAGFLVQVDDAVLMHEADSIMSLGGSWDDYRKWAQLRVDALNHALRGLPEDRVRYHVCWGSWHGPHVYDPPLADVVDLILQVNAGQYAMEQANPRHEHEWAVWQDVKLPDGKKLIPGVVTHHTNVVEHPEVVAQRLVRLANVVGRENVLGGTDCGFAQGAFIQRVHPEIQWAKLEALAEGARIASKQLWGAAAAA